MADVAGAAPAAACDGNTDAVVGCFEHAGYALRQRPPRSYIAVLSFPLANRLNGRVALLSAGTWEPGAHSEDEILRLAGARAAIKSDGSVQAEKIGVAFFRGVASFIPVDAAARHH